MSSEGSDIELQSALPKKSTKKMPKSPSEDLLKKKKEKIENDDPKKLTTKLMIHQALIELKSRKGVSLQAIKKYLSEKYNVDTEKFNYLIKKYIKKAVEEGTIVQTKGIGATGSFKLVPVKEKKKTKPKKKVEDEKKKLKTSDKPKKMKENSKMNLEKVVKPKKQKETASDDKPKKMKKPETKSKDKTSEKGLEKKKKTKITKAMQTPGKTKAAMLKRKSIGSIIKKPKMKPKAKA